MREIKFRGFSVLFNKWIYGVGLKYDRKGIPQIYSETGWYPVHKDSEGQFTGLTDSEGNEVYEGDILKSVYGGTILGGKVYEGFDGYDKKYILEDIRNVSYDLKRDIKKMKVIGNVYENTEMIY